MMQAGISIYFSRRHWLATLPRILGCKERRRVWTEAALLSILVLLDKCCSGWKRKLQKCAPSRVLTLNYLLLKDPVILSGTTFLAYLTRALG
jgi:hypothetical protein